jgi:hypothetical protein
MQRCESDRRVEQSCRQCAAFVARVTACAIFIVLTTAFTAQPVARDERVSGASHSEVEPAGLPRSAIDCQREACESTHCSSKSGTAIDDNPEALMDAADAARSSGRPAAAATCLRQVLRDHSDSPLAPLAAFTLGRVLLERLDQPLSAADAFALARALAPEGSLAQDALAREVEAWSKAGRPQEAYKRACLYVVSYPKGRRLHAVQVYGGLRTE